MVRLSQTARFVRGILHPAVGLSLARTWAGKRAADIPGTGAEMPASSKLGITPGSYGGPASSRVDKADRWDKEGRQI